MAAKVPRKVSTLTNRRYDILLRTRDDKERRTIGTFLPVEA